MEREYAAIADGFRRDDPSEWIKRLGPDFRLTLFNGAVQDRKWVVDYVTNNARTFHVLQLNIRIKEVALAGDRAVATVEQTSSRAFTDQQGAHRLDVGAVQLETWRKVAGAWRLVSVQEKDLLYLRRDAPR